MTYTYKALFLIFILIKISNCFSSKHQFHRLYFILKYGCVILSIVLKLFASLTFQITFKKDYFLLAKINANNHDFASKYTK